MKKLIFFVAGLLMLSACKKDEIVSESGASEEVVTISAQLPEELASRTVGDGSAVNRCILEIYDADGNLKGERQVASISTASAANFNATLTSGETYQVVLWADYSETNADVYYDTDSESGLKNISRITDNYTGNNDKLDAFFASETLTPSASEVSKKIELKRPFAQLNITASDYTALQDADKPEQVSITFNSVYTSFNALDGEVSGEQQLAYTAHAAIADAATGQMSYDYLFASVDQANLNDFTMSFYKDGSEVSSAYEFTNIPVKRNYRTNVKGNLLTVGTTVEVTIIPEFAQPDDEISLYDGTTTAPSVIEGTNTYAIKSAANLAYFMQNLTEFKGSTIDIQCNMDFGGATIQSNTSKMNVTVQGNHKTISNLVLNGGNTVAGFIPDFTGGTISDLTFDNLTVKIEGNTGDAYAGGIAGRTYGTAVISNCKVLNSEITGTNKVGGIVGFAAENTLEVTGCVVENTTVIGDTDDGGDCGGIVGYIANKITSATVENNYFLNSIVQTTPGMTLEGYNLIDEQIVGRGASLYVGTCHLSSTSVVSIIAENDATKGSKRIINGSEDGGLVRYQGLLGNIRSMNLPSDATLTINGTKVEAVDTSTEKNSVE